MAANPTPKKPGIKIPWMLIFPFFIFTVGILIVGRVYLRSQITSIYQHEQESLVTISKLKIRQIEQWHNERLGNVKQIQNNNPLLKSINDFIVNVNRPEIETDIKKWTDYMSQRHDYKGVFIYDTLLNERLTATQSASMLPEATKKVCDEVLKDMKVRMTDLYRNGPSSLPAMDIVIPLVLNNTKKSRPFGVLVLRIDPAKTLYPLIQSWPTPSKSAETLLIRKEGDSVLYLNDLRHIQNTALNLRFPISDIDLPAAKAVNGFVGVVEGNDYRKIPVLGYVTSLPDLNWFMVSKVDKDEIQAPLKRFSYISVTVTIVLILFVASVLLFWIRNQQLRESREHLRSELGRKQLDEALIISEARYRRLFEAARDGILILEAETGLIVDVNPYLVEMLGVTREQFLKKSIWEIGFFKDIAANKEKFLELQQKEYVRYEDLPLETADGRTFHVEFVSNVYQVSGYNVIQCNIRDITERKNNDEKLKKSEQQYRLLFDEMLSGFAVHEIICDQNGTPTDYRFLSVNKAFEKMTGLDAAKILGKTVLEILPGTESSWIERYGKVALTGESIQFENYTAALGKHYEVRAYCPQHGTFATVINEITERKQLEAEKLREQILMHSLIDSLPGIFYMYSYPDMRLVRMNTNHETLLGFNSGELLNSSLRDWKREDVKQLLIGALEEAIETGETRIEASLFTKDGRSVPFILTGTRLVIDGKQYVMGVGIDITDRKLAEEVSKKEQALSNAIIDSIPGTFYMLNETGQYVRWNAYQRDEIVGKPDDLVGTTNALDTIHPDDRELVQSKIANVLANDVVESVEGRVLLRGGPADRWLVMTGCRMLIDGHPFLIGIGIDITERKLAEELLRKSEEFAKRIIASSNDCIKVIDLEGNLLLMSEGGQKLLEIEDINLYLGKSWVNFWKEDDRAAVMQAISEAKNGHTGTFSAFSPSAKGKPKWWDVIVSPIKNALGTIESLLAVSRDITEQKQAEEEIKTKVAELERFNRLSVGREMRMIELKQKINDLSAQLNLPHPYALDYLKSINDIPDIGKKDI